MSGPLHLLLVDDDDVDRMAVRRSLEANDVEARYLECAGVTPAAQALQADRFDCVFLDIRLPDGDGLSLLRNLRAAGDQTPVIVLTGFGDEQLAVELMKAGAADYFSKSSLRGDRLAQSLRQAIRLRAAEEAAISARLALRRHADQLDGLARLSVELHPGASREQLAARIAERGRALLEVAVAGIVVPGPSPLHFRAAAAQAPASGEEPALPATTAALTQSDGQSDGQAVSLPVPAELPAERGPVSAAELSDQERQLAGPGAAAPSREWIASTLRGRDGSEGGIFYAFDKAGGPLNEGDVAVSRQLAHLAGAMLENARLFGELERASRARDDLIAVVSHDLRNPLNVITLGSSTLEQMLSSKENMAERAKPIAQRIRRASRHMVTLVNDLLDASRIEAGGLQLELRSTPAVELMDEVIEAFAPLATEKDIELSRREGASGAVAADRGRLFQVFSNLVGNAIKFTPRGGKVSLGSTDQGATICFDVQDNGPGIPAQHLPLLFDRYWQPRDSASREGAGLGLFIAKGIVEAHRGAISVESGPGKGSRFTFTVPAAAGTA